MNGDKDKNFVPLKSFFVQKQIYHNAKRGIYHLNLLESTMKLMKAKMIKHLHLHPEDYSDGKLALLLKNATFSYNNTVTVHHMTPTQVLVFHLVHP